MTGMHHLSSEYPDSGGNVAPGWIEFYANGTINASDSSFLNKFALTYVSEDHGEYGYPASVSGVPGNYVLSEWQVSNVYGGHMHHMQAVFNGTLPTGVSKVSILCIGGGGGGFSTETSTATLSCGGGGGGLSLKTVKIPALMTLQVGVGLGGASYYTTSSTIIQYPFCGGCSHVRSASNLRAFYCLATGGLSGFIPPGTAPWSAGLSVQPQGGVPLIGSGFSGGNGGVSRVKMSVNVLATSGGGGAAGPAGAGGNGGYIDYATSSYGGGSNGVGGGGGGGGLRYNGTYVNSSTRWTSGGGGGSVLSVINAGSASTGGGLTGSGGLPGGQSGTGPTGFTNSVFPISAKGGFPGGGAGGAWPDEVYTNGEASNKAAYGIRSGTKKIIDRMGGDGYVRISWGGAAPY